MNNCEDLHYKWHDAQQAYWDVVADEYDNLYQDSWSILEDEQTKLRLSTLVGTHSCSILDLACGTGLGYALLASIERTVNYTGLDISPKMVAKCQQKWTNLSIQTGTMSDLSRFASKTFDVVISLYTSYSFTSKPCETLKEVYRVLRPNGHIFISALNRWSLWRLFTCSFGEIENYRTRNSSLKMLSIPARTYSIRQLKSLVIQAGFTEVAVHGQGFFSGILQRKQLWRASALLSHLLPCLCHTLNVSAQKAWLYGRTT